MKHRTLAASLLTVALFLFFSFTSANAQPTVVNPLPNVTSVPGLINNVVKAILGIVGALALFMFVYGGMLWMTSGGNSSRIEKGKDTLIWATIGLFIIFASYAILNFILTALAG